MNAFLQYSLVLLVVSGSLKHRTRCSAFHVAPRRPASHGTPTCSLRFAADDGSASASLDTPVNGERGLHEPAPPASAEGLLAGLPAAAPPADASLLLPAAPAVTYQKFLTMQEKRVVVTIRYSAESGLRPYFLTVAKKLKQSHPDVLVERRILPPAASAASSGAAGEDGEATFEVLVDGTVVVGRARASRRAKVARVDMSRSRSVYVSMQELDAAIARARRRRRPSTTVYGDASPAVDGPRPGAVRKEMLREQNNGGGDAVAGGTASDKDDAFL